MKRLILWLAAWIERREFDKGWENGEPVILDVSRPSTWVFDYTQGSIASTYASNDAGVTVTYRLKDKK